MRGRRPRPLTLDSDDVATLQWLARCRSQPWFQVQHARILLGIAAGPAGQDTGPRGAMRRGHGLAHLPRL